MKPGADTFSALVSNHPVGPHTKKRKAKSLAVLREAMMETLEERLALTINYAIAPGTTLDIYPISSIIPASPAGMDRMAVNLTTIPGVAHGKIYRVTGTEAYVWGSGAPNTFTVGAGNNRITAGEGFRYVNDGSGDGTSESIPVTFRDGTGFNTKNDTIVISINSHLTPPVITTQPNTFIQIAPNNTATMSVVATGTPAPTYQWYQGIAPDASRPIAGATSATYTTPVLTVIQQYMYFCRVTNSGGSIDTLTVTVQTALPTTVTTSDVATIYSTTAYAMGLNAFASLNGAGQPALNTGNVTFTSLAMGGIFATSQTVANGNAFAYLSIPAGQAVGSYGLEAHYAAPAGIAESYDNKTITIIKANTSTAAANKTVNTSGIAQSVAVSAAVTSAAGIVVEGTVTFTVLDGATTIGSPVTSGTVAAGAASANYTLPANLRAGVYTLKAVHSGSGNYNGSTDTAHTLTVAPVITSNSGAIPANATTLTINGFGFDGTTLANNVVTFPSGVTGTLTAATATQLTISNLAGLVGGSLNLSVTTRGVSSTAIQVASVTPVVTSAATVIAANATTLTISGIGFSTTPANNTVTFSNGATGTVTASTRTQLTVTSVAGLKAGTLNASVTTNGQSSGAAVQVATVIPVVTASVASLSATATTLTIAGFGFSTTAASNTVTFSNGATGSVTAATATQLTVTGLTGLVGGSLTATVTIGGLSSTPAVQVATVTPVVTTSTGALPANSTSLVIKGFGFDAATLANNVVILPVGVTGTVTAATATQITVSSLTGLVAGSLNVSVTVRSASSGGAVQVATVTPVITSSTAATAPLSTSLTINGFGFSSTLANNVVTLSGGATGTISAASRTQITISSPVGLKIGPLTASVTSNSQSSGAPVQIATVVPLLTASIATMDASATTMTIAGFGFDTTAANNTVTFSGGATGTVTAATFNQLTISNLTGLVGGSLSASVTTDSTSSGAAVQVATVVPVVTSNSAVQPVTTTTVTINGFGFDPTAANNTVSFNNGITGTVSAATKTTLSITNLTNLEGGVIAATVTVHGVSSASPRIVASVSPIVTSSSILINAKTTTLVIDGQGFSKTFSDNTVKFSPAASGKVTASTPTQLTYTFTAPLTAGPLTAVVTTNLTESGSPVQVAIVDTTAPTASNGTLNLDSPTFGKLSVQMSENISSPLLLSHLSVVAVGAPALSYTPISVVQDANTHIATFTFSTLFANRNYHATLSATGLTDLAGNAMAADYGFNFYFLNGDTNRDRTVGFADLVTVAQHYGTNNALYSTGDLNGDGAVGFADLVALAQNYGVGVPITAAPVEAPAALAPVLSTVSNSAKSEVTQSKTIFSVTPVAKPVTPKPKTAVRKDRR